MKKFEEAKHEGKAEIVGYNMHSIQFSSCGKCFCNILVALNLFVFDNCSIYRNQEIEV